MLDFTANPCLCKKGNDVSEVTQLTGDCEQN